VIFMTSTVSALFASSLIIRGGNIRDSRTVHLMHKYVKVILMYKGHAVA
jgi:hypothetical protein